MGTVTSSLRTIPDPARTQFVNPKTGMLTNDGFWALYLMFRQVQASEGTAILEAFDEGTETALSPQIADLFKTTVGYLESPPLVTKDDLTQIMANVALEQSLGITRSQLEEVETLAVIGDYTSLAPRISDLENLVAMINDASTFKSTGGGAVLVGTHAARLLLDPGSYDFGTLFFETDRTVFYIVLDNGSGVHVWKYACGEYADVLANIPGGLGANDTGFLFGATDYLHLWRWAGAAWHFAPGDTGSGMIVATGNGIAPFGGAWAFCDGSGATVATDAGGTTAVVTPNLTGEVFIKGGISVGQEVAVRATWEATAKTDDITHNHTYSGSTDGVGDHQHGIITLVNDFQLLTGGTAASLSNVATQNAGAHFHTITSQTTDDETHHHSLTNANAQLKVPSESNGGLPLRIGLGWYIRR